MNKMNTRRIRLMLAAFSLLLVACMAVQQLVPATQPVPAPVTEASQVSPLTAVPAVETPTQAASAETPPAEPSTTEPVLIEPVKTQTRAAPIRPTSQPSFGVEGAASIGDPYTPKLGNTGYDVQRYTLRMSLDPSNPDIVAHETIDAVATLDGLTRFSLDFVRFQINTLHVDGQPAQYEYQGEKLFIQPPKPLAAKQAFQIDISYEGLPPSNQSTYLPALGPLGLLWRKDYAFAMNEPDGAHFWFACNDHPRDKATFRFELAVPPGMVGVANGQLLETRKNTAGALGKNQPGDIYIWEHNFPLAPAFATVAVGNYQLVSGKTPAGVPLRSYSFGSDLDKTQQVQTEAGKALDWMSGHFGKYPFEAFGFYSIHDFSASLETQTMVMFAMDQMGAEEGIHELAHMWFGDWVSLDSWSEIWRSEGFATYLVILYRTDGNPSSLKARMQLIAAQVDAQGGSFPLNNPPPDKMFGFDSYYRGALLAYDIHTRMGDQAFYKGLQAYFSQYGGGSATDAQFQAVLEKTCSCNLQPVFDKYFKGK